MSDAFNKDGWLLDFADATNRLHLLCEQWLYYHGHEHGDGEECQTCKDIGGILAAVRCPPTVQWPHEPNRMYLCAHCGVVPHWQTKQAERDEVCLRVCGRCGGVVEEREARSEAIADAADAAAFALRRTSLRVGDKVRVRDDSGNEADYVVRAEPWQLGHGQWVVGLTGISGGYSLDRVVKILERT